MESIKFKIFNKKDKKLELIDLYWFEENLIREIYDTKKVVPFYGNEECVILQYIGKQDKNHIDIYRDDIVKIKAGTVDSNDMFIGVVDFIYYSYVVVMENGEYKTFSELEDLNCEFEIVGNKHLLNI